jgi:polar amino acid transport system permease protein
MGSWLIAPRYWEWLCDGLLVTVILSAEVTAAALVLGFVFCVLRLSKRRVVAWATAAWLSIFRNTPLLVQLFIWYFGFAALLPKPVREWLNAPHRIDLLLFHLQWPSFEYLAGLVGLTLYSAAFVAEEFRSGVRGVPSGQVDAGIALGLRPRQVWRYIVLPQAVRIALPPLLGQAMNVVKNTSLAMVIGVAELSYASRQVETESFLAFQAFGIATVFYIAIIALISAVAAAFHHTGRAGQERA